jgi:hypothetical protein
VAHARFCSECGAWVVHAIPVAPTGPASIVPPPLALPEPEGGFGPVRLLHEQADELAGTFPASAAGLVPSTDLRVRSNDRASEPPPPTHASVPPPGSEAPPPTAAAPIAPLRSNTLDTGRPPPPTDPLQRDEQTSSGEVAIAPAFSKAGTATGWEPRIDLAREDSIARAPKTLVDERPAFAPSRSQGRTPRPVGGFLVSYQYEPLGTFWPLAIGANLVGRAGGRPDLDVGIADTTVSSDHGIVDLAARGATFEDRGSRNGTSVNGRVVGAGIRIPLSHGDRIRFGSFETTLVLVPYPASAAGSGPPGS